MTSTARDRIFSRIRTSLGVKPGQDPREAVVARRMAERQRHLIPARAQLPAAEARAQFATYLTRGKASVIDVATVADLPMAIATYLRDHNGPPRLRFGNDSRLAALPWQTAPGLEIARGRADPADEVTLSYALAGAAETGTLILASGPDNPVTLSFLPDTHLVVLDADTLVGGYEDAMAIVRQRFGDRVMPRTLNLISGPSRTADIGGIPVMGAHGPRHLAVFVVG